MLAYPDEYRREHEPEILGTLLQAAGPGQEWPSAREGFALLAGGLRTRARLAATAPWRVWADGLHLGLVLTFVLACGSAIAGSLQSIVSIDAESVVVGASSGMAGLVRLEVVLLAIGVVALARAAYEVGLVVTAGLIAVHALMRLELPFIGGTIGLVPVAWVLLGAAVAVLARHPALRPYRRPWPARPTALALAGVALTALCLLAVDRAHLGTTPTLVRVLVTVPPQLVVPAAALLLLAVVGLDARPALAATVWVTADVAGRAQTLVELTSVPGFPLAQVELETLVSLLVAGAALGVTVLCARRPSAP
jgi:hypothetical protein